MMLGRGALSAGIFAVLLALPDLLVSAHAASSQTMTLAVLPIHADELDVYISKSIKRTAFEAVLTKVSSKTSYITKAGHDFRKFDKDWHDVGLNSESCAHLGFDIAKHYDVQRILCPIIENVEVKGGRRFGSLLDVKLGEIRVHMAFRVIDAEGREWYDSFKTRGTAPIHDAVFSVRTGETLVGDRTAFHEALRNSILQAIERGGWSFF